MSLLTRPVEELLRYILTRLHGGILLGELDHKHLEASVTDGVYLLKNLELNPQTINSELAESPIHLTSAIIRYVKLSLPSLLRITEDPILVKIANVKNNLGGYRSLLCQILAFLGCERTSSCTYVRN